MNRLKVSRRVFNEEGPIDALDPENPNLFALIKRSKDRRERTFIILNKDRRNQQSFRTQHLARFLAGTAGVEDLSPDGGLMHTDDFQACFVKSSGFHVLWAQGV